MAGPALSGGSPPAASASGAAGARALLAPVVASLTLGLAPFAPEPHVVGKIRWVLGGAVGMQPMDWGDLALHGAPWVWLAVATVRWLAGAARSSSSPPA